MTPELIARYREDGDWDFSCPLHDPVLKFTSVSSVNLAIDLLKDHTDKEHPETKVIIRIIANNTIRVGYRPVTTITPGELL